MSRSSNVPMYQEIQSYLSKLLKNGKLQAGDQIPSERQLMTRFNTSNMPVRQAIQHFIDKSLFKRVHGRGTFVYEKALKACDRIAAVYVYDNAGMWASPFYTGILRGIEDVTLANDKRLMLQSVGDSDIYTMLCKLEDDVDGFLILDLFPSMIARVEKYVREKRKPLVIINYPHKWTHVNVVLTDNCANTRTLIQHLIAKGHRRVACLYHYSHMAMLRELHPSIEEKRRGYRQALEANSIPYDQELVCELHNDKADLLLRALVERGVSSIFCCSSMLATRFVMPALSRLALKVPDDISVVAYDNTRDTAESSPSLTVIDTDIAALGQVASRRVLEMVATPGSACACTLLQGEVLQRQSVRNV